MRIGNAAGFWGDDIDAARRMLDATEVDYLTLEYLAELTLSIMARQREKDPRRGFAGDFIDVLQGLTPQLAVGDSPRIVTNAGGLNPTACAAATAEVLCAAELGDWRIAVVTGDDLVDRLENLVSAGCRCDHLETGQPLGQLVSSVVSANAYFGAAPIADALEAGANVVITGRVADASLVVGPAMHQFDWRWDDWDRLAGASVAGHAIECGAQVTGGYSTRWRQFDLKDIGYPIAELDQQGDCVITKPPESGGRVTSQIVREQLVYEIGDPSAYVTPDVVVDFTTVDVEELSADRVAIRGATGRAAPEEYKVSIAYQAGYTATGNLLVYGRDCVEKARATAALVFERLRRGGIELAKTNVELLGAGAGVPGVSGAPQDLRELMLRISATDPRPEAIDRFTREFAPLITNGPAGLAGYAQGRPRMRPVLAYWPTRVPKGLVSANVIVRTASQWIGTENT